MSEHAWVLENIAAYHAGGLEAAERERLQQHVAVCEPCAQALQEAGDIERTIESLFAEIRPDPALEDRMVRALRTGPVRTIWYTPVSMRSVSGVAAVLLLGVLGAGLTHLVGDGSLPFPSMRMAADAQQTRAENHLRPLASAGTKSLMAWSPDGRQVATGGGHSADPQDANQLADERRANTVGASDYEGRLAERRDPDRLGMAAMPRREGTSRIHAGSESVPAEKSATETASKTESRIVGNDATKDGTYSDKSVESRALVTKPPAQNVYTYRNDLLGQGGLAGYGGLPAQNVYTYRNDLPAQAKWPASGEFRPDQLMAAAPQGQGSKMPEGEKTVRVVPLKGLDREVVQRAIDAMKSGGEQKGADDKSQEGKAEQKGEGGKEAQPGPGPDAGKKPDEKKTEPAPITPRKIIRSGEIEFEIESFDSAVATITKLVSDIKGGFIATVNSEKLPNGKVRGSVVVRVPPERLDTLVLDLRRELGKGGELKGQRIGSQDITKQYTDLESRLRAARAMEERLLQVIKTGKGEIKDLVQAEKELGVWRTKIEEIEGELRYYANLVALSTLTITLYEREIRAPFAVIETERIQMGVEVEDVDKALRQALAAVAEAKGRVTKSELKQHAAGQFSALLHFEVAPEAAGLVRDRLKQLGNVARLEIDRLQQTEGGSGRPQDAKSKRSDSQFIVALYNLTNVAPRETVQLKLVCEDVEAVYKAILARIEKAAARVVTSNLNRQRAEQTTGTIRFEVRAAEADAVLQSLKEAGEVMHLQVTENPDIQNTTKSKRGFNVELWALGQVAPRETSVLSLATRNVPAGYRALQEAVARAKGRILNAQLNEQDSQNITAQLDFEIRRVEEAAIDAALAQIGNVYARHAVRAPDNENVIDSKVRLQVSLINAANLKPRENVTLGIEVANVESTAATITALVSESQGRIVGSQVTHKRDGSVVAKLVFDVPLAVSAALVEKCKATGTLRLQESSQDPQVPKIDLAVARLDVTLSNTGLIVPSDDGLWPQVRKGLSNSLLAIFWILSWVIFGLLVVLPWALIAYGVYRLVLRLRKKSGTATPAA